MTNAREPLPSGRSEPAAPEAEGDIDRENETSNQPLPMSDEDPDVGLSQKGIGEDAVVRRETEI